MKPYLKLAALILSSSLIISLQGLSPQAVIIGLMILLFGKKLWVRIKLLSFPLALIVLFQLIFNYSLTPLDRLFLGLQTGIKIANLSLLVLIYTAYTSAREISQTFKFFPPGVRLALTITLNLIPVIFQEARNIRLVQSSRGKRLTNPLPIIVPLLHRTFQRAQQLALVLEMKGKS